MDSPPELLPYLSSNIPLAQNLVPTLQEYLAKATGIISNLDTEIDELERVLAATSQKRELYNRGYWDHLRLQASVRSVPPELWGYVFGLALGVEPFGLLEYQRYSQIREVCRTWKDALESTPDLCQGLEVHMDGELAQASLSGAAGLQYAKDTLTPWLSIARRSNEYHLVLKALSNCSADSSIQSAMEAICGWILATGPTPTILSIHRGAIFKSVLCLGLARDNKISHLRLRMRKQLHRLIGAVTFEEAFPWLRILHLDSPVVFRNRIRHSDLQSLVLNQITGFAHEFSTFLLGFPLLRELKIRCASPFEHYRSGTTSPSSPLIHPNLEILIVQGESLLLLLDNITFPSLKFFGLRCWGHGVREDRERLAAIVPSFLQRCSLDNKGFTASIAVNPHQFILHLLARNLPRGTRLHVDVEMPDIEKEVDEEDLASPFISNYTHQFTQVLSTCRIDLGDLDWLGSENNHLPNSEPIKLSMPMGVLEEGEPEICCEELRNRGYTLELLERDAYRELLRSSLPKMTVEWRVPV
jgi:hypothetical protein